MDPDLRLQTESVLEGRYQVGRMFAEGESNRVYEGRHLGLDVPVVLKQLRALYPDPIQAAEQVQLYAAQTRILAGLRHPNLVAVYDTFSVNGLPVLVMEMVKGRNLREIIELAPEPLPEELLVAWARQLLDVLEYLHSQPTPVIVRGLSPTNIVLDERGVLRLVDFGLAKSMDGRGSGTRDILKGLGEDGFAPLEQSAYSPTDARSDLYSLGALLFFLLTGEVPPPASRRVIATRDPLSIPDAPLGQMIEKLMQLRPQDRPESVARARELLPRAEEGRLCVDCRTALLVESISGVEIDRCGSCGGVWLDEGELDRLRTLCQEEEVRRSKRLATIPLDPDHPAMVALREEQERTPFWSALKRLFG